MFTEILRNIAARLPDKTAIQYETEVCTFSDLDKKIKQTADLLRENGVTQHNRIYLSGNNAVDLLVLFFAALELGCDVVLVDPKSTSAEIDELLSTLPAHYLLLEDAVFSKSYNSAAHILSYQFHPLQTDYTNENSAFITFFTSGSTGMPKAFGFSSAKLHRQVMNLAAHLNLTESDKVLCPVSFTHSHGVMMTLPFLLLGASVHYRHPALCKPAALIQHISQYNITVMTGVPFQYNLMLEEQSDLQALTSLRYAFCGSAPMSEYLAVTFEQQFGVRLNQAYGISEIGPVCVNLFEEQVHNFTTVGKVIRNIAYKIVDENGNKVQRGSEGELLVRSDFMTDGYINCSSDDLFRDGWMQTKDIVKEDEQGNLYILGRKSHFINVSGYKVYPVEIERVLLSMKGIKDAAVIGEADLKRTQTIKAVVTVFFPLTAEEIKTFCKKHLSKYKIPHEIDIVEELPVNAIGKVVKSKLNK
jgi:acyl-CoA synthetase (AMP-forming)/AMP-acid ligase II